MDQDVIAIINSLKQEILQKDIELAKKDVEIIKLKNTIAYYKRKDDLDDDFNDDE